VNDKDSLMPFSSKFGANYEEILDILKLAKKYKKNISGFSFHVGSGCYNPYQYYEAVKMVADIMNTTRYLKHDYKIVDIGGGFNGDNDKKFIEQADNIKEGMKLFNKEDNIKFISEPGRFFATKTQTLYTPIIAKKRSNNKNVYVIDESIYSSFSNITYDVAKPKLELTNMPYDLKEYDSIIFGRTCDSSDKILETKLPELEIGNYFKIKHMGAYTTVSSTNFNGFEQTKKLYLY
jgi:ornithine decarboxylase